MTGSLAETLHGGPVDAAEAARVRDVLVFEGAQSRFKFVCLLVMAAGIATFGLLGDSVAAVIGAMIMAPLMLPIMGLAYGVSSGRILVVATTNLDPGRAVIWSIGAIAANGADQARGEECKGCRNSPADGGQNQMTAAAQRRSDHPHARRWDEYLPTSSATTAAM